MGSKRRAIIWLALIALPVLSRAGLAVEDATAGDAGALQPGQELEAEALPVPRIEISAIGPGALRQRLTRGGLLVLDVRTVQEYDAGHIPGALHIPHTELDLRADEVRRARARGGVVVYCMRGPRSRVAEKMLVANGITNLHHLEGGFMGWKAAGNPVQRTERE